MIRRAKRTDCEGIEKLLYQVQDIHATARPDIFRKGEKKYSREELETVIADDSRPIYVYLDEEGNLKGYAFCILEEVKGLHNLEDMKTLYLDDLCVDEDSRGENIGTLLYEHVCKEAKALGCYRVTLHVWNLNEGAMKFYEKMGMAPLKVMMEQVLS